MINIVNSPVSVVKAPSPPVIVVGLPRSGSSYLAHLLSCFQSWFVFDDLYPYQKAAALGINRFTNLAHNHELTKSYINALAWQLRAKIKYEKNFFVPDLTWNDTFEMERSLFQAFEGRSTLTWYDITEEFVTRIALASGRQNWGYKTPQDFMHMDELTELFPGVRFIYILREPTQVLRSFKNLPKVKSHGSQDGESRQYHPAVYSLYWKKAYETVQAFIRKKKAPVEIIKFEELTNHPEVVADRLQTFLDDEMCQDAFRRQGNSALKKKAVKELTETETLLCQLITGKTLTQAGYTRQPVQPDPLDILDLAHTTATFTSYQCQRFLKNKKARTSILSFARKVLGIA